ncbi:hypothetical protein BHM03_00024849 [Ensete ventricosum]|nr:hypothetical protein BHM03_00024849 [Ensete ventricosum]
MSICLFLCFKSDDEREMCSRTVYCTNIDKKVDDSIYYSILLLFLKQILNSSLSLFVERLVALFIVI